MIKRLLLILLIAMISLAALSLPASANEEYKIKTFSTYSNWDEPEKAVAATIMLAENWMNSAGKNVSIVSHSLSLGSKGAYAVCAYISILYKASSQPGHKLYETNPNLDHQLPTAPK